MKSHLAILFLALFALQISIAQNFKFGKVSKEELLEKVHPLEADANAAILYREMKTHFEHSYSDGWYAVTEVFERIKIYKKEGFHWANKSVRLYQGRNNKREEISSLKAYTYFLEGGKIKEVKLKSDGIFDEKRSKYIQLKKFTMPAVKEGCVIEYKYRIKNPIIWNIATYRFQETIPINEASLRFVVPEHLNYKTHQRGWLPFEIEKDGRERTMRYEFSPSVGIGSARELMESHKTEVEDINFKENISLVNIRNAPSLKEELYVGNVYNYGASLTFELSYTKYPRSPLESYSTTWEAVSRSIYEASVFGGELDKTGYFKKEIDKLLQGATGDEEKMIRIFEFVKNRMNWNSYYGNSVYDGVKKAYKKGTGNVAEINLMLTAMFKYAGLNANPILVSTKSNGIPLFPTINGFNCVISGVEVQDDIILFNASNKEGEPNILESKLLNWRGRIIREDKSSAWVSLLPKKHATKSSMVNATIYEDLSVTGTSKHRFSGHYSLEYRDTYKNLNEDATRKKIEKNLEGTEVSNIAFENLKTLYKPIKLTYDFDTFNAVEEIEGKLYFSPLLFMARTENPFKAEKREYPIDYSYSRKNRYLITINIPKGYIVESIPKNINFGLDQGMGGFKYAASVVGNKIQLSVEFSINQAFIAAEDYGGLKRFYELLIEKENEKVVLSKG